MKKTKFFKKSLTREQFKDLNQKVRELAKTHGIKYSDQYTNFGKRTARIKLWLADRCSYQFMREVYSLPFVKTVEYRLPKTGPVYSPYCPLSIYVEYRLTDHSFVF